MGHGVKVVLLKGMVKNKQKTYWLFHLKFTVSINNHFTYWKRYDLNGVKRTSSFFMPVVWWDKLLETVLQATSYSAQFKPPTPIFSLLYVNQWKLSSHLHQSTFTFLKLCFLFLLSLVSLLFSFIVLMNGSFEKLASTIIAHVQTWLWKSCGGSLSTVACLPMSFCGYFSLY